MLKGISFDYYGFRHYWLVDKLAKSLAFEARICRFEAYRASQVYNRDMEAYRQGDAWNLPEDPRERRQRVSEIAARLCDEYDDMYFDFFNRVLERVREEATPRADTPSNLGRVALSEQVVPKTP